MIEKLLDTSSPLDLARTAYEDISKYEKIVLWGAGEYGKIIGNYLKEKGKKPYYYCDSNIHKVGTIWNGLEVKSTSEIEKDAAVIITCNAYREISKKLICDGFFENQIFFFDVKWITQPEGKRAYIIENIDKFEKTYNMLADEKSKKVFMNLLNYRSTYKIEYLEQIVDKHQYFDEELIQLEEDVVFLDAGSYIGDTLDVFLEYSNRKYEKVICLEPIEKNVELLRQFIDNNNVENVDIYKVGASNKKKELHFDSTNSMASRETEDGDVIVKCDSIDHIVEQSKLSHVDFIKMDIEGAEYDALLGARDVIEKYHPILAICVYHKPGDYFEIPELIKSIYSGYKLYFRHYELLDEETVCYAIAE